MSIKTLPLFFTLLFTGFAQTTNVATSPEQVAELIEERRVLSLALREGVRILETLAKDLQSAREEITILRQAVASHSDSAQLLANIISENTRDEQIITQVQGKRGARLVDAWLRFSREMDASRPEECLADKQACSYHPLNRTWSRKKPL